MSSTSEAVSEIRSFVEDFKADSVFSNSITSSSYSLACKQLHALLIWSILIEDGKFPSKDYGLHPKEGISDISQAYALLTFSLYKPARVMARSAIENLVRVVVAGAGGDFEVKSVYILFDNAKAVLNCDPTAKGLLAKLKALYAELCLTAHSAHKDHVALRIPFELVFAHDQDQCLMTIDVLKRVASNLNQILYARFFDRLPGITHKNRDVLLDSLPRALKRAVQS